MVCGSGLVWETVHEFFGVRCADLSDEQCDWYRDILMQLTDSKIFQKTCIACIESLCRFSKATAVLSYINHLAELALKRPETDMYIETLITLMNHVSLDLLRNILEVMRSILINGCMPGKQPESVVKFSSNVWDYLFESVTSTDCERNATCIDWFLYLMASKRKQEVLKSSQTAKL